MEKLFNEVWRPVKGYEGLYEVSSIGNVRSLDRHSMFGNRYCLFKGKPLKAYLTPKGYLSATLFKNDKGKHYFIHRLVAEAFIPNPNNLPYIDHINIVRDDNRVENLRWCTHKENMNNPLTRKYANIKNRSKEVNEKRLATKRKNQSYRCEIPVYYIDEDGTKRIFKSMHEAQRQTHIPESYISRSIAKKMPISGRQWYKEEKTTV